MAFAGIHPYHQQWPPYAAASPPPILFDSPDPNRPGADEGFRSLRTPLSHTHETDPNPIPFPAMAFAGIHPYHQQWPPYAAASPPPILFDCPNGPGAEWPLRPSAAASPPPILVDNPDVAELRSVIDKMSERGVFPWMANNVALKDPVKLRENSCKYRKLLSATEFFYAGDWDKEDLDPIFGGVFRWPETCNDACTAARFALSLYNKNEGMELEFKKLIRVNAQLLKNTIFFLTMEASDVLFYEAKVLYESRTSMKVFFVRVARHYPEISPEIQHLTGPNVSEQSSSSRQVSNSSEDSG